MRDFVTLAAGEIREHLAHGAFLTVDRSAHEAYLHAPEKTAPVEMSLIEELIEERFIQHTNAHDRTIHIAIYRHVEPVAA